MLVLLAICLLGAGPSRKEQRTAQQLQQAATEGQHEKVLKLAEQLLTRFPDSEHRLSAHRAAGRSAMALERWREARASLESYLQLGGREELPKLQYQLAICLAREGRLDAAPAALRNVAVNDSDPLRSASAARELVQLRLFAGEHRAAIEASGLLLDRAYFEIPGDLVESRKAASQLDEAQLSALERNHPSPGVAGLAGFLLLEVQGALLDSPESDPARMSFARRHPTHPLLSEVPGATAWAAEVTGSAGRTLGVLLPLSGRYAAVGELAQRGIQLAQSRAEELGWPAVEMITLDTTGDPELAAAGLNELAEQHKAVAVLGPLLSAEGELVAQQAQELALPTLMMVQRPGLAEGRSSIFNTWVTAEEQVDALVEHAVQRMGLSAFAIAYPAKESSARLAERFWTQATAAGAEVTSIESYAPGATDFRETAMRIKGTHYLKNPPAEADLPLPFLDQRSKPQLAKLEAEPPPLPRRGSDEELPAVVVPGVDFQAVFVPDNYKRVSMLAPGFLFEEINLGSHLPAQDYPPVVLMGGAALNHPELVSRGGKYTEGVVLVDSFFLDSAESTVQGFAQAYRAAYQKEPSIIEANAYDAALLAQQLLADGERLSRREFQRRLSLASPQESVTGARGVRTSGEMRHEMLCLTVRKGAIVQLWPAPAKAVNDDETEPGPAGNGETGSGPATEGGPTPLAPTESNKP
ncbi:MAG: hypothetical protein CMP23_09640 [Rickettsiales bacterium]|nr:hypothetical protein [Rickettsiales bacterium]